MSEENKDYQDREEYKNLPKSRQALVDAVVTLLDKPLEWRKGWRVCTVPQSMKGTAYHGENNVILSVVSMIRGYDDARWMTFNQMRDKGWSFKQNDDGTSMGKGAGVPVSFFEMYDRKTKKPYDKSVIRDLPLDEQQEYYRDNVYPMRKSYTVFNASIIKGVPELAKPNPDLKGKIDEAEEFLSYWNENKTPITYGGERACYAPGTNTINLPKPEMFESMPEFYGTAFHEISHSCQAFTRPGEKLDTNFGSDSYSKDELSAELSSVFMTQKLCGLINTDSLTNSAAYLKNWLKGEKGDGKTFFDAVSEADKLSKYAVKEYENGATPAVKTATAPALENAEQVSLFDTKTVPEEVKAREFFVPEGNKPDLEKIKDELKTMLYPADPLAFRAKDDGNVPSDAYDARMSLLSDKDRERVEESFRVIGPHFKTLYFGGKISVEPEIKNVHALATYCAFIGGDEETAKRLFKGSAYGKSIDDEYLDRITKSAVKFSKNYSGDMLKPKTGKDDIQGK